MANNENLKPFDSNQSREEAKKNGQIGGIKSGEARRAKKTMKAMLDYLLEKEIENKKGEKASTQEAISVALIKQALSGNVKAFEVIRDTIGEKPEQNVNLTASNPQIIVASESDKELLNKIQNVKTD